MNKHEQLNLDSEKMEQDLHLERFAKLLVSMYEKYGDKIKVDFEQEKGLNENSILFLLESTGVHGNMVVWTMFNSA